MAATGEDTGQIRLSPMTRSVSEADEHGSSVMPDAAQLALPPADRGKSAYQVLAAAFILEALVWGFPFSFGIFQDYYSTHEPFKNDAASIAAIGTTATGVMYLGAPLVYAINRKYPRWRKTCITGGFIVLLIALISASFANSIPQLLATQGLLYGLGGAVHYFPAFLYLDEWCVSRRGLAYGIVWAGNGAAGSVIPFVMQWLIREYGFRTALRTWAIFSVVLTVPALFMIRGRLPIQHASTGPQRVELGFLKTGAFWVLQAGNMLQAMGYFMPNFYLPSFAQAVGLSALAGTIALALVNAAAVAGAMVSGFLVDRYHVTTVVNFCAVGTVVACFLFWSFAVHAPMLFVFAIMYGFFAGGFASTWAGAVDPVRKKYPAVETGMMITLFAAGKGVSSVISGPLSGVLVRSDVWKNHQAFAFGSGYGYLIIFSGVTAGLSTVGWVGKKCGIV